jgi:hypothetical protein
MEMSSTSPIVGGGTTPSKKAQILLNGGLTEVGENLEGHFERLGRSPKFGVECMFGLTAFASTNKMLRRRMSRLRERENFTRHSGLFHGSERRMTAVVMSWRS